MRALIAIVRLCRITIRVAANASLDTLVCNQRAWKRKQKERDLKPKCELIGYQDFANMRNCEYTSISNSWLASIQLDSKSIIFPRVLTVKTD
jgi:hypothetical protein